MITVLHTIDTTGPGGAETVFVNVASKIDPAKFRSVVAINGSGWVCDELQRRGLAPHVLTAGRKSLRYLQQLRAIVRREQVDVIHAHLFGSNVYSSLAGIVCGIPAISTFHGAVDIAGPSRFRWAKYAIINAGSQKIVFVSDHLREVLLASTSLSPARAERIYNGIDLSAFRPGRDHTIRRELGLREQDVLVGAIGNIRPAKGYDIFLQAATLASKVNANLKFVIAGHASGVLYDSLLALRAQLGLKRHVFFLGFRADVVAVLRGLDVFALTSTSEGLSIATIEAIASGLPVVATRSGGPEEIVQDECNGLLIDPASPEQLANAILRLGRDTELRSLLARNAVASAARFSEKAMIAGYENLYGRLTRMPPQAAMARPRGAAARPPTA